MITLLGLATQPPHLCKDLTSLPPPDSPPHDRHCDVR
ncbi:hypothetical protein Cadr_000000403 [Camelus dromedarius]|uniref:Uncharacterized protein n=1 Tax=Camelus dromedarius TaxID=9838 RepID=A0A5N4EJJ5_CAMDR|nr:hypothetical protein Cadr_000000403 [Camelus dromedarius]